MYIPLLWGPTLPHCSIKAQDDGSESRRKIINNSHGILHPGRLCCKLTWQQGWKRRESSSGYLFVCSLPHKRRGKNYQTGSNWMQSARFLADFSASAAYPPTPWGETSRNPHQIRRWHIKNHVTKKVSNGCQRCGSSSSFPLGSFYCSPVYWGCMVSEGNALSGLPCRSGIWSWWLCDSLGWGIAVSAEQETELINGTFQTGLCAEKLWDGTSVLLESSLFHFLTC